MEDLVYLITVINGSPCTEVLVRFNKIRFAADVVEFRIDRYIFGDEGLRQDDWIALPTVEERTVFDITLWYELVELGRFMLSGLFYLLVCDYTF